MLSQAEQTGYKQLVCDNGDDMHDLLVLVCALEKLKKKLADEAQGAQSLRFRPTHFVIGNSIA